MLILWFGKQFSDIYDVVPCVIEELLVLLSRPKETAWGAQTFRSSLRSALCALSTEVRHVARFPSLHKDTTKG
jgi:hypothetical protein